MRTLIGIFVFVISCAPAFAQSSGIITQNQSGDNTIWSGIGGAVVKMPSLAETHPLMVFKNNSYDDPVFVMDDGACLRGPLRIGGKEQTFILSAGADFPTGCSKETNP